MTTASPNRKLRLVLTALTLNVVAVLALAFSTGYLGLRTFGWKKSADVEVTEHEGKTGAGSMSISVFDGLSPEEIETLKADGFGEIPEDDTPAAGERALEPDEGALDIDPLDWPFWRGPRYDGTSPETGLIDAFNPKGGTGSNVAWKRDDLGTRSTPIVMRGKLYVLTRTDRGTETEGERVVCIDAGTGETIWENRFNVWLSDVPDTRVAWSSVVGDPATGNVYALGVCGFFQCLDGNTGKTIWSVPMHERFGLLSTYGGRTNYPIVFENLVIISGVVIGWGDKAKPAHRFMAFDKANGDVVWFSGTRIGPYDTNYSSPTITAVDGRKMLVFGSGDGQVWAFQPRTGVPIWHYALSRRGLNVAPLVVGNTVFMGHSEENETGTAMGTVVAFDATGKGDISEKAETWRVFELMMGKCSPVLVDDRLYCPDDRAKLHILDAKTGESVTPRPVAMATAMRASPLYADGKLYMATQNGRWYIYRPDREQGVKLVDKGRFPRGESCDASPICAHGSVYFTTSGGIYCLRDPKKTAGAEARPPVPKESDSAKDSKVAHLQVVPTEVLMQPGRDQQFTVNLFNARGQFLSTSKAAFSVKGPGRITAEGLFTANNNAAHEAAIITAKVGDQTGQARVRIVPPLAWEFTFDDLSDPPITWVGARYRHVLRTIDGNRVMVKIATIPKGTRSRCWFGPSDLSNYTIQADVLGAVANSKRPDIGLIAQGYALVLQGESQSLQVRSWVTQGNRTSKKIDYPWKPDTWYVMKFRAENAAGKALLKGKVWPRDQEEPAEWSIEVTDESPNSAGSPGLFGNARGVDLMLDNIKVFAN